ncbi:MAG: M48 family metallopeptidase [Bernardetiaceae bacterium]|nr:M48 family metallopeptidase [Bernardetiaceae bacterium]
MEQHYTTLKNITPQTWEHPADRAALSTLKKAPGLDTLIKTIFGATSERSLRLIFLASAVKVSERQFSTLHGIFGEVCQTLDSPYRPDLFVSQNPFLNAGAIGVDKPFIVLNSSLMSIMNEQEIRYIMGHELGHALSGHALYKTLLQIVMNLSRLATGIPLTGIALMTLITVLKEWDRKSELSADRAGLLAVQQPDVPVRALMKMAGGTETASMDLGAFIAQAEEYTNANKGLDSVYKFLNLIGQSHPFPVLRVLELVNWVRTGEYDNILQGDYREADFTADWQEATSAYGRDFTETTQSVFKETSENISDAARKTSEFFKSLLLDKNNGKHE